MSARDHELCHRIAAGCAALDRLPRLSLGRWPTPVAPLPALSRETGVQLAIKRDDRAGAGPGGSKIRKLEYLLAEALDQGARTLLTLGGTGSTHVRAVAHYGERLGLPVHAIIFPQPETAWVHANQAALATTAAVLHRCPSRIAILPLLFRLQRRLDRPYLIGPGGSSPVGTLGCVRGALELAQQVADAATPLPQAIFVALGSGGTVAGLRIGFGLAGLPTTLRAVRVVERPLANTPLLQRLTRRTMRLLQARGALPRDLKRLPLPHLDIVHNQAGRRYGQPTSLGESALLRANATEGISLDPVYTAKAFAALLAAGNGAAAGSPLLFWHTGSDDAHPQGPDVGASDVGG